MKLNAILFALFLTFITLLFSGASYGFKQADLDKLLATRQCAFCDLKAARLADMSLPGTRLSGAILSDAELTDADLSQGNLRNAMLARADLSRANLSGADLSRATSPTPCSPRQSLTRQTAWRRPSQCRFVRRGPLRCRFVPCRPLRCRPFTCKPLRHDPVGRPLGRWDKMLRRLDRKLHQGTTSAFDGRYVLILCFN